MGGVIVFEIATNAKVSRKSRDIERDLRYGVIYFSGVVRAAVVCARTLARSTNPAESSTGWPLTPHSGSARVTSASALRAPSPVLLQSPLTSAPSAPLFLPGDCSCYAMSGIGSIPGAAGGNPVVFFDISIGGHSAGRIKMEVCAAITPASDHACQRSHHHLGRPSCTQARKHSCAVHRDNRTRTTVCSQLFADVVPRSADNFRQMCTGEFRWASDARAPSFLPPLTPREPAPTLVRVLCARQEGR